MPTQRTGKSGSSSMEDQLRSKLGATGLQGLREALARKSGKGSEQKTLSQAERPSAGRGQVSGFATRPAPKPEAAESTSQARLTSGPAPKKAVVSRKLRERSPFLTAQHTREKVHSPAQPEKRKEKRPLREITREIPELIRIDELKATRSLTISRDEAEFVNELVSVGRGFQFTTSRLGQGKAPIDLVIGMDLGTSSTKIVVRAPHFHDGVGHAVPVPAQTLRAEEHPHLWMTRLWLDPDGRFHLVPVSGATTITGLKAALLGGKWDEPIYSAGQAAVTPVEATVAYLALLYRFTRGWFLRTQDRIYRRGDLLWHTNVGLPAATCETDDVADRYRALVKASWILSGLEEPVTMHSVRRVIERSGAGLEGDGMAGPDPRSETSIVPEVAAEVAGFAQSTRREDGLYVLVDAGAATLDVCSFMLHHGSVAEDHYDFFTADVEMLGVKALTLWDGVAGPHEPFDYYAGITLRRVIWDTRNRRDPNSPRWSRGGVLPIFLCGGGAASRIHRQVVESMTAWLKKHSSNNGAEVLQLEQPESLQCESPSADFHRLAVAWGLSHPKINIGKLTLPKEIEDVPARSRHDLEAAFISKDMV